MAPLRLFTIRFEDVYDYLRCPSPVRSWIWGYDPAVKDMYPYDPEMARSLLAQTGYAGGLELTVLTTDYEPYIKTA